MIKVGAPIFVLPSFVFKKLRRLCATQGSFTDNIDHHLILVGRELVMNGWGIFR